MSHAPGVAPEKGEGDRPAEVMPDEGCLVDFEHVEGLGERLRLRVRPEPLRSGTTLMSRSPPASP